MYNVIPSQLRVVYIQIEHYYIDCWFSWFLFEDKPSITIINIALSYFWQLMKSFKDTKWVIRIRKSKKDTQYKKKKRQNNKHRYTTLLSTQKTNKYGNTNHTKKSLKIPKG